MKRWLLAISLLSVALALPAPAPASSPQAQASAKSCPTPRDFMIGPFFADQLRARNTTCRFARVLAKRFGRSDACISGGPDNRDCRVRRWRCVFRQTASLDPRSAERLPQV